MGSDSELMLYRVILVHDTFDHFKITVEFPGRPNLSAAEQWDQARVFLVAGEYKLESATPLGMVRV